MSDTNTGYSPAAAGSLNDRLAEKFKEKGEYYSALLGHIQKAVLIMAWPLLKLGITPNQITGGRMVFIPIAAWAILSGETLAAVVIVLLTSYGDLTDGAVARKTGLVTEWGKLWDSRADKLVVVGYLLAESLMLLCPPWVFAAVALREYVAFRAKTFKVDYYAGYGLALKNPSSLEVSRVKMWIQMFMVGLFLFGTDSSVYTGALACWVAQEIWGWTAVWLYFRLTPEERQKLAALKAAAVPS
ncbi:MAG: CDP-alcohol phosphatidyltransferase family protein [bacterium]